MTFTAVDVYRYDSAGILITRKCSACHEHQPLVEFYTNHPTNKHGIHNSCKRCQRDRLFRRTYGITLKEYERIFEEQKGRCAICGIHESELTGKRNGRRLHVDHCHDHGMVRGILCGPCNTAIGSLHHDKVVLLRAIDYLERSLDGE